MRAKGRRVDLAPVDFGSSLGPQKKFGIDPGGTTNRNNAIATKVSPTAATGFMMNSSS
jgi:hypothetical protein